MNPTDAPTEPIWASEEAFAEAPEGYGWVDLRGKKHPCTSIEALLEKIGEDRDAKVSLVWTPSHPRMQLPEEWPEAAAAVRRGREHRLNDDLAESSDRIRWFALVLTGVTLYLLYQGWTHAPEDAGPLAKVRFCLAILIHSISLGLSLLMFVIFGFIPWFQARKRQMAWRNQQGELSDDCLQVIRFETWLESQNAPATRLMMILITLVGIAQIIGTDSIQAAGLMKGPDHASEWWRVYTAPFLHGNIVHFLMNGAALLYLGKRLEVFAKWPHIPLVFLAAAAIGNEASLWLLDKPAVGASGGLMGWLGFLLAFECLHARLVPRTARRRLLTGVLLTGFIGLVGYRFIDNAAHGGGLLAGLLYGVIVFPKSSSVLLPRATTIDAIAGFVAFGALIASALFAIYRILGGS